MVRLDALEDLRVCIEDELRRLPVHEALSEVERVLRDVPGER